MLEHLNDLKAIDTFYMNLCKSEKKTLIGEWDITIEDKNKLITLFINPIKQKKELQFNNAFAFLLIAIAMYKEDHSAFWDYLTKELGIRKCDFDLRRQKSWKNSFYSRLLFLVNDNRYKINEGNNFVDPIFYHSCVPNYLLEDFFNYFIKPLINVIDLNYDEIISVVNNNIAKVSIDNPIKNFCKKGGDVAYDLIFRCVEYVKDSRNKKDLNEKNYHIPIRIEGYLRTKHSLISNYADEYGSETESVSNLKCFLKFENHFENGRILLEIKKAVYPLTANYDECSVVVNDREYGKIYPECYERYLVIPQKNYEIVSIDDSYEIKIMYGEAVVFRKVISTPHKGMLVFRDNGKFYNKIALPSECYIVGKSENIQEITQAIPFEYTGLINSNIKYVSIKNGAGSVSLANGENLHFEEKISLKGANDCLKYFYHSDYDIFLGTNISIINAYGTRNCNMEVYYKDRLINQCLLNNDLVNECGQVNLFNSGILDKQDYGKYELKFYGPLGKVEVLKFIYLPEIEVKYDKKYYLPGDSAKITVAGIGSLSTDFGSLRSEGGVHKIFINTISKERDPNVSFPGICEVEISLKIPKIYLSYLQNNVKKNFQTIDYADLNSVSLIISTNIVNIPDTALELSEHDHVVQVKFKRGDSILSLGVFSDTINHSSQGIVDFQLSVGGNSRRTILRVIKDWTVSGFNYTQNPCSLTIQWNENKTINNRIIRLWDLLHRNKSILEYKIENGSNYIEIKNIKKSNYLVEFVFKDNYGKYNRAKMLPTKNDSVNIFDLELLTETEKASEISRLIKSNDYEDKLSAIILCDHPVELHIPANTELFRKLFYLLYYLVRNVEYSKVVNLCLYLKEGNDSLRMFVEQARIEVRGLNQSSSLNQKNKRDIDILFWFLDFGIQEIIGINEGDKFYSRENKKNYYYRGLNEENGKLIFEHRKKMYEFSIRGLISGNDSEPADLVIR